MDDIWKPIGHLLVINNDQVYRLEGSQAGSDAVPVWPPSTGSGSAEMWTSPSYLCWQTSGPELAQGKEGRQARRGKAI